MPFGYYSRLSARNKGIYRRSDGNAQVLLPRADLLEVSPVEVKVLAVRPSLRYGELHGLYTHDPKHPPRIQVWMRTAHHRRVVAFRTFLRTLLHEVGHHLDYTHLKLADSFHTEGFFKRESSLFYQLVPKAPVRPSGK